ncbi:MAG TPA: ABC transporter permease subunit [Patescibacteria group bacterium]|nr:ABC transporter permease subunit [Patescibacteria group bacterium]
MNWLAWRQYRKQFLILTITLALYAAVAIPTGIRFWHTYQKALAGCVQTNTCSQLSNELLTSGWDQNLNPALTTGGFNLMMLIILAVPFLLGTFWGAPLIAREYADGTNKLIWTQSVSRRKWLTIKLVWMLIAAAIFAGIFAALTTWWSKTGNALSLNRFGTISFGMQGIVPAAYAVFAVALGIAFGTWFKRTLLALGITLGILLAVQIVVPNVLRSHYMTPVTQTVKTSQFGGPPQSPSSGAWVISSQIVNSKGQVFDWANPPKECIVKGGDLPRGTNSHHSVKSISDDDKGSIGSENGGPSVRGACLSALGYRYSVKYQPSYRYWDFQRIETVLYLSLAVIPITATYWLVLKRDA